MTSSTRSAARSEARPVSKRSDAYHHGDLRNALLNEGRRLLEHKGAAELSLREVARGVGVSEAAPSRHFGNKEGLLAGIATEGFRELGAQRMAIVERALAGDATVRAMMLSYVRYAQANKGVFNLMVGPRILEPLGYPELQQASTWSFNLFSDAVVELARQRKWPEAQVEFVAHGAWAMEHGLATLILADRAPRPDRRLDLDRMIDFSIDMLLAAIAKGPMARE